MFGLFKSWPEKCFSKAKLLSEMDEQVIQKWFSAFETQITEMHDEGERKPEFCLAWCATGHLHKIVNAENPQDKFLGSRCKVRIDDDLINKVTVRICETTSKNMPNEMKDGVLSSLEKFNS